MTRIKHKSADIRDIPERIGEARRARKSSPETRRQHDVEAEERQRNSMETKGGRAKRRKSRRREI
jgi:hypothetical protein